MLNNSPAEECVRDLQLANTFGVTAATELANNATSYEKTYKKIQTESVPENHISFKILRVGLAMLIKERPNLLGPSLAQGPAGVS